MTSSGLAQRLAGHFPGLKVISGRDLEAHDPGLHPDNLRAGVIAEPASVEEVSAVLAYCTREGIAVVPHGGLTGLAAGAVSSPGQIIVSTRSLNRIISIDVLSQLAVVEAGVTLEALQAAAAQMGLSPGIDLGARGSATIGGMISTNAGGVTAFRHGVMRNRISGLAAVLPDGNVVSDLAQVSKCNEGLDVKQLLIGAEGTIGIVTHAVVRLVSMPAAKATALVIARHAEHAIDAFHVLAQTGKLLAFELMNSRYLRLSAQSSGQQALADLADEGLAFVVEVEGPNADAAQEFLQDALAAALDRGVVSNAILAKSLAEAQRFWLLREDSWVVDRTFPYCIWFDVAVPLPHLDAYISSLDATLALMPVACEPFIVGHLGDGNLHITVAGNSDLTKIKPQVEDAVFAGLKEIGGSFSAEHGIGLEKRSALLKLGHPGKRTAMLALKKALDPKNIMNPGKIY